MGLIESISSWRADRKIRKLLKTAKPRSLGELRESAFMRVIGTVQPHGRALEAPLSGRLCAYYSIVVRARVTEFRFVSQRRRKFRTVADEDVGVPFELEADGRRAVVDPTDAWISSGFDYKSETYDARTSAVLARLGVVSVRDDIFIQEAILGVGERIAVFGAGVFEPDPGGATGEQGYRDGGPTRFRFSGTAQFPLVIRDDLQDL